MSKNSTIDDLFKAQLQPLAFDHADAAWDKMEARLLQQQKKRKPYKRYLLLFLLVMGSATLLTAVLYRPPASRVASYHPAQKITTGNHERGTSSADRIVADAGDAPVRVTSNISNSKIAPASLRPSTECNFAPSANMQLQTAPASTVPVTDGMPVAPEAPVTTEPTLLRNEEKTQVVPGPQKKDTGTDGNIDQQEKTGAPAKRKPVFELAAGIDLSLKNNNGGKYAQVLLNIPLSKKTDLVTGIGISSDGMSESYRVSEKQNTANRETDARLQSLTMLQFPILYQQSIPRTKLLGRAGITPVYIINASIVNVPSSFVGTVIPYRTFTLKDLNRVNVLFTAGLQYQLTRKLALEIKGNYGLTELVKNSYINQSNVNNNFKSLQGGLNFRF